MSSEIEYQTEGMQRTAAQVDGQVEPLISRAEDRVMDAARHQDERKWGTKDLGAPLAFGHMYEKRLRDLEYQIHELVQATGEFSQKVKLAAAQANATEEEIAEIFGNHEQSLSDPGRTVAQSSPQTGQHRTPGTWES